jgi:hypothetical protein
MVPYMTPVARPLAAPPLPVSSTGDLALHARVRVPNGRIGNVIGFYRGPEESVVVQYDRGDSGAFPACDLIVCS